jgi:hypothetical protein
MTITLSLLAVLLTSAPDDGPKPSKPLAITHVTALDLDGTGPARDVTVVVEGDRITAVGPGDRVGVPGGATVVDGAGKFLIPGLWDMHVHFGDPRSMKLFLANGVTGVRVMWGNPSFGLPLGPYHFRWRGQVESGTLAGPRLVVASNILDGPKPIWPGSEGLSTPEQGREAVRKAKAAGADFIKVYDRLPRDVYFAIADEARASGLRFAGHVPSLVTAREASAAGQASIEHLSGVLADCSSRRDAIAAKRRALVESGKDFPAIRPELFALGKEARDSYDEALAADLFSQFQKNRTWQCPTLTVLRALASLDDDSFRDDPRLKYVDLLTRLRWDPKNDFRLKTMTKDHYAEQKAVFARAVELVGQMQKAGVEFLAGTDELNPYVFPGFSLHDELALLVKAGLSPREALQAATVNPARFLGREATSGTVAAGKSADLVLLDADPSIDIANTTRIRAVVARGRLLDRAELDRMLAEAEVQKTSGGKPGGYCPDH